MTMMELVTEQSVVDAFKAFIVFVGKIEGTNGQKALFRGFRIQDGVKELVVEARKCLVEGNFFRAVRKLSEAEKWLEGALRKYCANSVNPDGFFDRIIGNLPMLDEDILVGIESARKHFEEIAIIVATSKAVSLDEASTRYWALLDAVNSAPAEQRSRDEAKVVERAAATELIRRQKIVARKVRQESEDAAATARNKKRDEGRREERERIAGDIASQLASIFRSDSARA